jgi:hypothetical protein
MPAALERELKRRASKLGLGKKRKAAYVYGTLRKTGWVPSHQKKMEVANPRLVRLAAIDERLNDLIQFQDSDDPYNQRKFPWLKTGATVGAGAGGLLAHQAIRRTGGYGANLGAMRYGPDLLGRATGAIAPNTGAVGAALSPAYGAGAAAAKSVGGAAKSGSKLVWSAIKKAFVPAAEAALQSKEEPITLDATLLEPFQGSAFKSKIEQLQFPSGLSPLAAMRLPFPKLMALLQKKQILRQVFSKKHEKLIELNAKLDEIQFQDEDDEQRRRWRTDRSGKTIKGGIVATAGLAGGYAGAKAIQATHPIKRVKAGHAAMLKVSQRLPYPGTVIGKPEAKRYIRAGFKAARYARFASKLDDILEFKLPQEFIEKAKEKSGLKKKKKERVSHGGGT